MSNKINVELEPSLISEIEHLCDRENLTKRMIVTDAIKQYLAHKNELFELRKRNPNKRYRARIIIEEVGSDDDDTSYSSVLIY